MPEAISMTSEWVWNGRTTEPAVFMLMLMLLVRLIRAADGKEKSDFGLIQSWRASHPSRVEVDRVNVALGLRRSSELSRR
jgi:hypothetical protein